ncbi:DUF4434 domain-containing protein [Kitasatospora sp. NPDC001664]
MIQPNRPVLAFLAALAMLVPSAQVHAAGASGPRCPNGAPAPVPTGTYVVPSLASSWTAEDWVAQLRALDDVGMNEVYVQWAADSTSRLVYYPGSSLGWKTVSAPDGSVELDNLFRAADLVGREPGRHPVRIHLGLTANEKLWWRQRPSDPGWLVTEAENSRRVAADLWNLYGSRYPGLLAGWYLWPEVQAPLWTTPEYLAAFEEYVRGVATSVKALSAPGAPLPVLIAPFYGGELTEEGLRTWTALWHGVLTRTAPAIDAIAIQDGGGTGRSPADIGRLFAAASEGLADLPVAIWNDAETYDPFDGDDLPIRTLAENLCASRASRYLTFAANHLLPTDPARITYPAANSTYLAYASWTRGEAASPPPAFRGGLRSVAAGHGTVRLYWDAATSKAPGGVAGYRIRRDGELVEILREPKARGFTDRQLASATHSYRVEAFDAFGGTTASGASSVVVPEREELADLAVRRPYVIEGWGQANHPDDGSRLTDGLHGPLDPFDPAWVGADLLDDDPAQWSVTVDLGADAPAGRSVGALSTGWLQARDTGIFLPTAVEYAVSAGDGAPWTTVGRVERPAVPHRPLAQDYRLDLPVPVTARYVRATVTGNGIGSWALTDEIEVLGRGRTP